MRKLRYECAVDNCVCAYIRVERIECGGIGWTDNKGSETTIEGYSMAESKSSLEGKAEGSSKLEMTRKLMDNECKARCVGMDCKRRRRMMAKLRGGTAELGIEIGRWHGLRREDRVCKEFGSGDVEDTEHFVMRYAYVVKERKRLENLMSSRVKGWHELGENEKVLRIMDRACCDEAVARAVESLWKKRFVADVSIPHQT